MIDRRTFLQRSLGAAGASVLPSFLNGCRSETSDGKIHVSYWEKWGGNEAPAMKRVVDQFNASQDRIIVHYLSVSQIDRKVTISIAGGDPPDIAGIWTSNLPQFADRDAILPLGPFIEKDGMTREQWLDRYIPTTRELFMYEGDIWGLPSTPSSSALHWNKSMFRDAGLDPEKPPTTLIELDDMARVLSRKNPKSGQLMTLGFLPQEPGFWAWAFIPWFGGRFFDDNGEVCLANEPANLAAMQWVRKYTEEYGLDATRRFTSGFGGANTPQSAFLSEKIAMVFQGVWVDRYVNLYAPGLDYGVAPWPHVPGTRPEPFTVYEADSVVICRGSRNPEAAWEFIKFLNNSNPKAQTEAELRAMETVCFYQEKISPLREWSPFFTNNHPHRYAQAFRDLLISPAATHTPKVAVWQEYGREINNAITSVRLLESTPEEALKYAHGRAAASWDRHRKSIERLRKHA